MKKLLVASFLCLGLSGFAQGKGKVEFGLNVGLNSSVVSDSEISSNSGTGFNVGVSADYYFSESWSLKGKVIYDQKGWNDAIISTETGDYGTNINLNYVTIPIMANWHFAPKRNWYLNFGPYTGFLIDAKDTRFETDLTNQFENADFGLAFGIGVKIPVSTKLKLSLEYEGQAGLSDILANNPYGELTNTRSSFNIGINFLMN